MNRKKQFLFFLIYFLPVSFLWAQKDPIDTKDYILCINSYAESSPWSNRILSRVAEYVGKDLDFFLYAEHMNMQMIEDDITLHEFKDVIFSKYRQPQLLLLLGNPSLILREEYRKMWGDIPIIACMEEDYMGPKEAYLHKVPIPAGERTPIASLADPYNLVMMHSNLYIHENIDLVYRLIPGMKKFIFIGDGRQINSSNDSTIRETLEKYYPDIEYQYLSAAHISTNQLLDSLADIDPETTGVLFSSWIYKHTFAGNTSLVTSGYKLIGTSAVPLFALNLVDFMSDKEGMVGGYAYDQEYYNQVLISKISQILQGKQARQLPFYIPADAAPIINYDVLLRKGLSPSLCPPDTHFLNKPPTFWEQNGNIIIGAGLFILLLTLLFLYRLHNLNMVREAQRKEITAMANYKDLIANMPVLYMQEELITDDNGTLVDAVFREVNTYFEKDFLTKKEVIGKKSSAVFPEATP